MADVNEAGTALAPVRVDPPGAAEARRTRQQLSADRGSMVVIAENHAELTEAQGTLIDWAGAKLEAARRELNQAVDCLEQAKAAGLSTRSATRLKRLALRRVIYFEKLATAFRAGYTPMPALQEDHVVAVRSSAKQWTADEGGFSTWSPARIQYLPDSHVPLGEGSYSSPQPEQRRVAAVEDDGRGGERKGSRWVSTGRRLPPELPMDLCRPRLVASMQRAMDLGVFDDLVLVTGRRSDPDPILAGRIQHHAANPVEGRAVWLLVAWWIDAESMA